MHELDLMPLLSKTPRAWVETALSDFDSFLVDHAACERKASALAISLACKYPDREALVEPMICLAREELAHFHEVYLLMRKRGLALAPEAKDPYVGALLAKIRHEKEQHFLDRLLVAAVVEARGCERFKLISDNLTDLELKTFYKQLAKIEAGHYKVFTRIAGHYFSSQEIEERLNWWLQQESAIMLSLPLRAAVH